MPNIGTPKYIKQKLTHLKEMNSNTVLLEILMSHSKQWIDQTKNKETADLNNIYGPNGPNRHASNILTAECTFFSRIHGTFSR